MTLRHPIRWLLLTAAPAVLLTSAPAMAAPTSSGGTGYDVSYPQCGATPPSRPLFAIVGVSDGRPWNDNPCLASEYAWARTSTSSRPIDFYMNTANPGTLSTHWGNPATPKTDCNPLMSEDASCAYDYGWNAAAEAMAWANSQTGTAAATWWLDVETANSWSSNTAINDADLQGSIDYLSQHGASNVGVYSTASQWSTIAGTAAAFTQLPNWLAGGRSAKQARTLCSSSFGGGRVQLVQYPAGKFDGDTAC
jgi:hypothetical protein